MSENIKAIADAHQLIMAWYKQRGRHHLPWRTTRNPYKIYLSEIMLQQTQVATVLERFYYPFLERFPSLQSVAEADVEDVLKRWEGLGYYTRARNLHRAAKQSQGQLPKTVAELEALPGIGKNTAHAVASFAFGQAVPVMEANVKRVLCRVFAIQNRDDPALWQKADELMNENQPFEHNQAMMDIGSMLCTPKNPSCSECPLYKICLGKAEPERYPKPKEKKKTPIRNRYIYLIQSANKDLYLAPRETRFLGGLYGFVESEKALDSWLGQSLDAVKKLGDIEHVYSHFKLQAQVFSARVSQAGKENRGGWFNVSQIDDLAISGADKKALALLVGIG